MASFLNVCRFTPTAGGTTDWTYSSAVTGYQSPAAAGVVNGATYKYRAENSDLSQWELGEGTYNTATGVLTRTTVLYNSSGTGTGAGQSGAGTPINFTTVPQVAVVALKEDLVSRGPTRSVTAASDTLVASDFGKLVKLNRAGAIALGTSSPAALGDGWYCDIINTNTGIATLTPGSGTIDAAATAGIYQSESMRIWCDGANLYTANHAGEWVAYTPTLSATSGTLGTTSASGRYRKIRTKVDLNLQAAIVSVGTATGNLFASVPISSANTIFVELAGAETQSNGKSCRALLPNSSSLAQFGYYDNSTTVLANTTYNVTGFYEVPK